MSASRRVPSTKPVLATAAHIARTAFGLPAAPWVQIAVSRDRQLGRERTEPRVEHRWPVGVSETAPDENVSPVLLRQRDGLPEPGNVAADDKDNRGEHALTGPGCPTGLPLRVPPPHPRRLGS